MEGGWNSGVSDKPLAMRGSWVFACQVQANLAPSWAIGVARDGETPKAGTSGGGWV